MHQVLSTLYIWRNECLVQIAIALTTAPLLTRLSALHIISAVWAQPPSCCILLCIHQIQNIYQWRSFSAFCLLLFLRLFSYSCTRYGFPIVSLLCCGQFCGFCCLFVVGRVLMQEENCSGESAGYWGFIFRMR